MTLKRGARTREATEHLRTRPGSVNKQADARFRKHHPEELGEQEQVVIMDPDEIAGLVDVNNGTSEGGVGLFVRSPIGVCAERAGVDGRNILPKQVVEEGPESCREIKSTTDPAECPPKNPLHGSLYP